jgi:hypothetical protein
VAAFAEVPNDEVSGRPLLQPHWSEAVHADLVLLPRLLQALHTLLRADGLVVALHEQLLPDDAGAYALKAFPDVGAVRVLD